MSRPPAEILNRTRVGKTERECQILRGEGYWTVVYDGEPINILHTYYYIDRKKYANTGFAHEGHANNLAKKLNHMFDTDRFTVRKLL